MQRIHKHHNFHQLFHKVFHDFFHKFPQGGGREETRDLLGLRILLRAMPPKKTAPKQQQKSLEQTGTLPLLKKPAETVGKQFKVIGSHWGSACPAADRNKEFVCVVKEFTVLHTFSPTERGPAVQLLEMGTDGMGGDSDPFWMKYPYPFLDFYYKAYPLQKEPAERGAADAQPNAEETAEKVEAESNSVVYQYLEPVRSEKKKNRQVNVFSCKVLCTVKGVGHSCEAECGSSITLFGKTTGPFFKHVRRKALRCPAHAALMEELNLASCRQARTATHRHHHRATPTPLLLSLPHCR